MGGSVQAPRSLAASIKARYLSASILRRKVLARCRPLGSRWRARWLTRPLRTRFSIDAIA
jgi:hypothetical protein